MAYNSNFGPGIFINPLVLNFQSQVYYLHGLYLFAYFNDIVTKMQTLLVREAPLSICHFNFQEAQFLLSKLWGSNLKSFQDLKVLGKSVGLCKLQKYQFTCFCMENHL